MNVDLETSASVNAEFAKTILQRAAEIFADGQPGTESPNAYTALEQAKDEFLALEQQNRRKQRTYGFRHLVMDLGSLIQQRHPRYAEIWGPINRWSREADKETVAQTLQEAAIPIGNMVAERTKNATKFELMSEKERGEYLVMQKATAFLQQQGLIAGVEWDRENSENDPIDYWATINGTRWAFEITALRKDDRKSHRRVGDRKPHKNLHEELEDLSAPIPKVQDGPEALQAEFNRAIEHGNQQGKLHALNGAKYCLVIHNQQFLYEPSWQKIAYPELKSIDTVLMLHMDDLSPAQVWEVVPNNGFGKPVKSQNISDLVLGQSCIGR